MSLDMRHFCGDKNITTTFDSAGKSIVIALISTAIIGGNVLCLIVLNSRWTRGYFMESARMLMTSLACTDCMMGLTVTAVCVYPALYGCWPYGKTVCKLQALFISSLFHESTLALTLIAIDRYISIFHPLRYRLVVTRHKVIAAIVLSWLICFTVYGTTIFGFDQYYYDDIAINCEPYYPNASITATVMSLFYFTPAVIMLVCYLRILTVATQQKAGGATQSGKQGSSRRSLNLKAAKTLGLITIGFFVAVTPWTITQMAMTFGYVNVHPLFDFTVTWLAISNSFWNVIIYCLTSTSFRLAADRLFCGKQVVEIRHSNHHPLRMDIVLNRSTLIIESLEHIHRDPADDWRGRNGSRVGNGCAGYTSDNCKELSDTCCRPKIKQQPYGLTHQSKRSYAEVPQNVSHSSQDHEIIYSFEDDVASLDSLQAAKARKASLKFQNCLCLKTDSPKHIPENMFPADERYRPSSPTLVISGSSDSELSRNSMV